MLCRTAHSTQTTVSKACLHSIPEEDSAGEGRVRHQWYVTAGSRHNGGVGGRLVVVVVCGKELWKKTEGSKINVCVMLVEMSGMASVTW